MNTDHGDVSQGNIFSCLADTLQQCFNDFEYERIVTLIQDAASQEEGC